MIFEGLDIWGHLMLFTCIGFVIFLLFINIQLRILMKIPEEITNDKLLEIVAQHYGCSPKELTTCLSDEKFYIEYSKEEDYENTIK